jgi:probable addiction module antidote protein
MEMVIKTRPFDPATYLDSDEAIAAYLDSAMESGDASAIADALGVVARTRGMAQIAMQTGLSRESLYKALSAEGNPEFSTILRVVRALGLRISLAPRHAGEAA